MATRFLDNVRKAIRAKGARWTAGETAVSSLPAEVRARMLSKTPFSPILPPRPFPGPLPPPAGSFDWTNVDGVSYVTPAKSQDGGTCAAYASTAALESCVLRMGLSHDPNLDLAEHAIIGTIGGGGNLHGIAAFMQTTGLPPESMYSGDPSTAAADWQSHTYHQVDWGCLYPSVTDEAKAILVQNGPVVTTMNCPPDFFAYKDGVYSNVYGNPGGFHAILVVGYDDEQQCFKVKNSWGTDWGQDGFGLISYGEFRSALVNFGWDIHTYTNADAPGRHPGGKFGAHHEVAIDPLALVLSSDIYVKLHLPDPPPIDAIQAEVRKSIMRMDVKQRARIGTRAKALKVYAEAMDRLLNPPKKKRS